MCGYIFFEGIRIQTPVQFVLKYHHYSLAKSNAAEEGVFLKCSPLAFQAFG